MDTSTANVPATIAIVALTLDRSMLAPIEDGVQGQPRAEHRKVTEQLLEDFASNLPSVFFSSNFVVEGGVDPIKIAKDAWQFVVDENREFLFPPREDKSCLELRLLRWFFVSGAAPELDDGPLPPAREFLFRSFSAHPVDVEEWDTPACWEKLKRKAYRAMTCRIAELKLKQDEIAAKKQKL
jgi:hypothetical protein